MHYRKNTKGAFGNTAHYRTQELVRANRALQKERLRRKKAEKTSVGHHFVLEAVFEGISEPLLLLDKNLEIQMMNQAARIYYEVEDGKAFDGYTCYGYLKNGKKPCSGCQVPKVLDDGEPVIYERDGFMQPDRVEKVSVYPIKNGDGAPDGCIVHFHDLTEEKRMEKELIQADKMISLGVLVSGVAHEINNPNNLIMLNTPILVDGWQSVLPVLDAYFQEQGDFNVGGLPYSEMRDTIPTLLDGIWGGSKRIMRIVKGLKDYARFQPKVIDEPVDINKTVESAVALMSNQIKKVTQRFSVHYGEGMPQIKGDRQKLEQVLVNLLQNACQALSSPDQGITLRSFIDSRYDMVAVEVKDEGAGIPTGLLARIMDPFFTTNRDVGGTGLGLSVSSKIVQDHGGRIGVQTKEGEGSTFTVLLPTERTREKVKVLVADDDEIIRDLVTKVIQRLDRYLVTVASNGAEACLMLGSDPPSLLILDIKMPDMNGLEVCRQIKKTPSLSGVKVIIVTGHHESYEARVLSGMGFTNILAKPFSPQKLMDMINDVMQEG